ncbi:MAG: enoyl-CoA hydratase/isomerase family protein [Thermoanaerobaculia bacterium]
MSEAVRLERDGRLATLILDRPPLNILDLATLQKLGDTVAELTTDDELQLLVLRSASPRAFSAGVAVDDHVAERIAEMLTRFHAALERLRALPALTLAAVQGYCLGGGLELAAACDLVLAEEDARLGQPEVKLGCFPPYAAALYPRRIGPGAALDLLVTGRELDGREAARIGMVQRLAPAGQFEAGLERLTGELLAASRPVARLIKRAVRAGEEESHGQAVAECERLYLQELTRIEDMEEGLMAFRQKRPPSWRHR